MLKLARIDVRRSYLARTLRCVVRARCARWALALLLMAQACSHGPAGAPAAKPVAVRSPPAPQTPAVTPGCPARMPAPSPLPGVKPEHLTLDYWIAQLELAGNADDVVLSVEEIERHNAAVGRRGAGFAFSQNDLLAPVDGAELTESLAERLSYMLQRLRSGEYVTREGKKPSDSELALFTANPLARARLRVALAVTPLRCGPFDAPLYSTTGDPSIDRNACSSAHEQEVIQTLGRWPNGMRLVRTRYSLGWINDDASLSPPLPASLAGSYLEGQRVRALRNVVLRAANGSEHLVARYTTLPRNSPAASAWVASEHGFHEVRNLADFHSLQRPLTRRSLLQTALGYLDAAYGFGGQQGGLDCSRFVMEVFESFGLVLPRHSSWQAQAGSLALDVSEADPKAKLRSLDRAAVDGVVLLHFPGHIMLYLGRNQEGSPMVVHALGEYSAACASNTACASKTEAAPKTECAPKTEGEPAGETLFDVRRVTVSDLELGRGSSRRSLLDRVTRMVVFGGQLDQRFGDVVRPAAPAVLPSPASCRGSGAQHVFVSPRWPTRHDRLRVVVTGSEAAAPASLQLIDPAGQIAASETRRLGGPPFSQWTTLEKPTPGWWTAVLADGARIHACRRFRVRMVSVDRAKILNPGEVFWTARRDWSLAMENLYAAFVEQLFDFPADDGRTWPNLHVLLQDQTRNLLYNHLGLDEEQQLHLQPDCADLPFALRAYFAWKLGLPFGYRSCTRGDASTPPRCQPVLYGNGEPRDPGLSHVASFHKYLTTMQAVVHSASGRTQPQDLVSDLYPVSLSRQSLLPGTVFADPYGHIMVLVKWFPQRPWQSDGYGVLMAAEAQPDSTVSRRRFWRGSFLFKSDTARAGAGFKAFRPLRIDPALGTLAALDNGQLSDSILSAPFSIEQYEGSADDFYDRMDVLINPLPLDAADRLTSLVDALEEQVRRRVISVDNGTQYMRSRGFAPIEMPSGHAVFETRGAWEDYSTPSRDMRLLIAMDTVLGFPGTVERRRASFALADGERGDQALAELRDQLPRELERRSFGYRRSDGSEHTLSLRALVERQEALEIAYNPNDCVELRWGAPAGSDELSTCDRRAPEEQRVRMEAYRFWFRKRERPPRGR
ncbi:MAG: NlpC/P60 family protein [Proteobacteria bacterium]|nr:NlpC/P60 family protein [Pseudomonadota bacterium]